ncbi:hypothetical protein F5Y07DRAFT_404742 [Xylaria sp. FL0933]|nr:hypothetical protein F5Y07DRAFT_404742 [Xylaria sp. FL0933]
MPLHSTTKTTTTRRHHGLFGRTQPAHHQHSTHHHQVHHHQKRHVTLGDKVSGALLKLKGTLTHRPGQKVSSLYRTYTKDLTLGIHVPDPTASPLTVSNHRQPGPAACTAQTAEEAVVLDSHPVASIATKLP